MFPLVIVTGLSGAGKSFFLKVLEDLGYETIDNLPLSLLDAAVEEKSVSRRPLAIGVDVRSRHFSAEEMLRVTHKLRQRGVSLTLTFLESDDAVLQRRYRDTRRIHPLDHKQTLEEQIGTERLLLQELREGADELIDTSLLTPPEFKGLVRDRFSFTSQRRLTLHLMSFAFRQGIPRESDMLFDMRFLKNPYYQKVLKPLTGQNPSVEDYLAGDQVFQAFSELLRKILTLTLPLIEKDGRGYFIIAFGCSGGQHRSVFTAEWMGRWLKNQGYNVQIYHRELPKADS